jgi:serine/threonine-protein kinase
MAPDSSASPEGRRASNLDPLSLRISSDVLYTLVLSRRYDEAIEECRKALAREPNFAFAHAWMGVAYTQQRRFPEAVAALQKAQQLDPNYTIALLLAHVEAAAGNRAAAGKLVREIEEAAKHRYVCDYEIATVYTTLGEKDQAFRWLKRGEEQQCNCLMWLRSEPWMDPLRADPRYVALIKRVGFDRASTPLTR